MVNTRRIARLGTLAVGLGIGAAWAHTPIASADTSNDWLSSVDGLLSGASPAATVTDFQISFNGTDLFPTLGNEATATTVAGQYGLAIAYGDGAKATAEGGTGDYALAAGTHALANAGSLTAGATNFNYDSAVDVGNNADPSTYNGATFGSYAGGGSLIGGTDSGTTGSSHDSAYDFGNNSPISSTDGGSGGASAGDSALIGEGSTAGNGDTAYVYGNITGFGDGSDSVGGNNDYANTSGTETGNSQGAFAGFGNNNSAIADTNYTKDFSNVEASHGDGNYAYVYGPDNSTAVAGGYGGVNLGNNDIAYVSDPFSGTTGAADNAVAGSTSTVAGSNDLAEVLLTHGDASALGNLMYDIVSLFGSTSGSF
ncbi:hypothetical protein [Mycobacterium sp.]|uniref:hypothetical protein n=1 Tax=Mycobacterium sp. TaxID=1785 RepID=UPI003D138012